jgi:hypothetical protein
VTASERGGTAIQEAARVVTAPTAFGDSGGDAYIRRAGRGLIISLYAALRAIRLYPLENAAVQNAVQELADVAGALIEREHELEIRVSGEFVFINTIRLRLDLDNYASFSQLLSLFRSSGVGSLHLQSRPAMRDWQRFLALVLVPSQDPPQTRYHQLLGRLEQQGLTAFQLGEPRDQPDDDERAKSKEIAKKTYSQSVAVTKDLMTSVRMGRSPNIKKIKRVVQGIVDQILNEETSLIGLTTIRDYYVYTFTHCLNV